MPMIEHHPSSAERRTISNETYLFARAQFQAMIVNVLDNPSDLLHPEREEEPQEAWAYYQVLASDLGVALDAFIETVGTPFERQRLKQIISGAIEPPPRKVPREVF